MDCINSHVYGLAMSMKTVLTLVIYLLCLLMLTLPTLMHELGVEWGNILLVDAVLLGLLLLVYYIAKDYLD